MDLSRIESLTREMLEVEAKRRGIKSPEFRTRTELVRLILRHQYGGQLEHGRERLEQGLSQARMARALLGSTLGAALQALPDPLGLLGRFGAKQALPPRPVPRPESPAPPPTQEPMRVWAPPPRAPEPAPAPEPIAEARAPEASASTHVATPAPEETQPAAPPQPQPERQPQPQSAPQPIAAPRSATTRTFEEEPIRTRSMALLLAAQGHRERALSIYDELIERAGGDRELEREAAALRRNEPIAAMTLPTPREPRYAGPSHDLDWLPDILPGAPREELVCEGDPMTGLTLRWAISPEGAERARAVLGVDDHSAELTLRLVAIRPDAEKVVRSEITEHGPVAASGEWRADPLSDVARCVASIGLRAGGRFVSIAHARPNHAHA